MLDRRKIDEGLALFNAGKFYDAHEALEDAWREMSGDDRRFLQGLIQVAAAFHHYSTGNPTGARSLLARGASQLDDAPDVFLGVSMPPLRAALRQWQAALAEGSPVPPLPRLQRAGEC
ncbi:MAG: DUF309 domain-containing protein [Acidobacteriia bacterium]|nr:DUF309 domain-containing protein [Terriglobia bacterium]